MEEKCYPFKSETTQYQYEFLSSSEQKEVKKVVIFTRVSDEDVFNLALLDELPDGTLSDITESKNNDMKIIFATVIKIIDDFLNKNPQFIVVFKGSDTKRQRLYRIIIDREFDQIKSKFNIFGYINEEVITFKSNINFEYFLITKR